MTHEINGKMLGLTARTLVIGLVSTLMLAGCGSSFEKASSTSCVSGCDKNTNSGHGDGDGDNNNGSTADNEWKNLDMVGKLGSGRFASKEVLSVDKTTNELVVTLPMPANPFLDGAVIDIPLAKLPGAHVGLDPIQGGGSALVLRVPLHYLMDGVNFLPSAKLPNGDPLPAIPSGEMPSMAVQLSNIKDIKASIYLSVSTLGVFVNTPFDPLIYLSIPIKNADGTRTWGYLTSVPAKAGFDGGFFIAVQIPDDLARIIDNHL